jgi:hypothetical protein
MFETGEMTFSVVPIEIKYIYWIGPVGALQFWLTALSGFLQACLESAAERRTADRVES